MQVEGDYARDGCAMIRQLLLSPITQSLLGLLKEDLGEGAIAVDDTRDFPNLLRRPAFEIYGPHSKPLLALLWGLTPAISTLAGSELLPSYCYLRIYREGDLCLVHSDRYACEHSVSLTLDYSDGNCWPLEVEVGQSEPTAAISETFGSQAYHSFPMNVGDAVLYRGVEHRHGRITPNPNEWSAHLFLHWVEVDGSYVSHGFEGMGSPKPVHFRFG